MASKYDAKNSPGYPTNSPHIKGERLERMRALARETSKAFPPPFKNESYEGPRSTPNGDRALARGREAIKKHVPPPKDGEAWRKNHEEPIDGPPPAPHPDRREVESDFPTEEELERELGGPEGMFTLFGCHYRGMFANPRMNVLFDVNHKETNVSALDHGKRVASVFLDKWSGLRARDPLKGSTYYNSLERPYAVDVQGEHLVASVSASHGQSKRCPMRPKSQQVDTPTGMPAGHPLSNKRFTTEQRDSWVGHVICSAEEVGASPEFQEKLGLWIAQATSQYAAFYDEATGRLDWMSETPMGKYVDIHAPPPLAEKEAHAVRALAEHGHQPKVIAAMMELNEGSVDFVLHPDKYGAPTPLSPADAQAARTLAEHRHEAKAIAALLEADETSVDMELHPEKYTMVRTLSVADATTARTLAEHGMESSVIAAMLHVDEVTVDWEVHPEKFRPPRPEPLAEADAATARLLVERGQSPAAIAAMLKVDEKSIDLALHPENYGPDPGAPPAKVPLKKSDSQYARELQAQFDRL